MQSCVSTLLWPRNKQPADGGRGEKGAQHGLQNGYTGMGGDKPCDDRKQTTADLGKNEYKRKRR